MGWIWRWWEELELGVHPLDIQLKDVGQWVWWGLELGPVAEGPPLSSLREEPMEVEEGAELSQEDDAVGEGESSYTVEQATLP